MTIILFLIDTSASMCQKAYVNGVQKSYLDVAKGAVETFLKYRQRSQDCLGDRYMLLTFEEPPSNVKAGWKENHATFMNELKNLQCNGLTSMGEALKNALDLLNLNRMQSGIDTYGQGRCPFYLESSVIIVITDGGKYSFRNGVQQEIILPLNAQIPGTKFTKEPFRWDQRLFSLVLRMSGNKIDERAEGKVPHDDSHIERMCEVTGGRSYRVKSHYVLNQCIESLVQKVQPGVVLHFEPLIPKDLKDGEVQDLAFQTTKKMIYVQKHPTQKTFPVGYWPLPESYWPDPKATTLPARDAHPKIRVMTPSVDEPQILRNFPVDKYEIEASPLTLQILSKRDQNKCWPVTIANGMHAFEQPFGYLKANLTFTQVYLFVLAYNYPVLLPLLHDLIHKFVLNPPNDWMYKFSAYVRSIPQYYCPFLRRALVPMNVPYPLLQYMLPENMDNFLSPNVANYLKQIKNTAKQDQENLCLRIYKQLKQPKPPYRQLEMSKLNCGQALRRDVVRNPMLRETFLKLHSDINVFDNYNIIVPSLTRQQSAKNYRNPFDIPRRDLIDEIARMRNNFLKATSTITLAAKDSGHCLPISEMGNYQEYLKNKETPLREIEPTNVRQHMFGNPYKKDKHMVMVDEADLGDVAPIKPNAPKKNESTNRLRKRKAGPIRKDFIFRRLSTDSQGNISSSSFDSDDDTASECSDFEDNNGPAEQMPNYDFSEIDEFPASSHIKNFINGNDEPIDSKIIPELPIIQQQPPLPPPLPSSVDSQIYALGGNLVQNNKNNNFLNSISTSNSSSSNIQITNFYNQTSKDTYNSILTINLNGTSVAATTTIAAPITPVVAAAAVASPAPPPLIIAHSIQNDINDAQEISKILQQCHIESEQNKNDIFHHHYHPYSNDPIEHITTTTTASPPDEWSPTTATVTKKELLHNLVDDLSIEEIELIRKTNLDTRKIIFNDIRRPGRDYSKLFEHLNLIQGNFETKFNFIQICINESLRFRRKRMAEVIQEWWEKHIDTTLMQNEIS